MNKTEYMNTLQQELQGLPASVIAATLANYQQKFIDGAARGWSEADTIQKLASPRLAAAQQRANTRFQNLKSNFGPGNIFGFFIALIGVMILNFFMLVPVFLYGVFMFFAYIGSTVLYVTATIMIAASLSGVTDMAFKIPHHHSRANSHAERNVHHSYVGSVSVDISESGVTINKERLEKYIDLPDNRGDVALHIESRPNTIHIKNRMETRHFFIGVTMLFAATALLLLCLWLTRLGVIGFGKYLVWTVSLLRAPVRAETTASA
jgi:uncharacterized membrane protein